MRNFRCLSSVWKNITKPLFSVDEYSMQLMDGIGFSLGNGERILFWSQKWILRTILKYMFPRIYNLAICKDGCVAEFGFYENERWKWKIDLRKRLFDWKKEQWNLSHFVGNISESKETIKVAGENCGLGTYLPKSRCFVGNCFMVQWVSHCDPWRFFSQWQTLLPNRSMEKVWGMLFGATTWSIWLGQNEAVNLLDFDSNHFSLPVQKKGNVVRKVQCWIPPPKGVVKFNVDGSAFGKPGPAGIGGVMRNHEGT
ncbi:hypothetical protein PTKIN_Ptkin06aG0130000 [Pterospermum kingtungense]